MRPIEKRIAAVEARVISPEGRSLPIVYCPSSTDPEVLREEKASELGRRDFIVIVFVASDGAGGIKPQPWHKATSH